ncbi:MAG: tetratricopeptide repeat protein [Candidatus Omnitrophica bacterium]|nr:tetratricopeptide repeat protein [Candidatus Omnitrophota bacterium]
MIDRRVKLLIISIFILIALCVLMGNVYAEGAKEFYDKAQEYLNKGMYDQAIAELNKAIQIDPSAAEFYTLRGHLYRTKTELTHAISDYAKSIELNPNNGEIYYYRAICYMFTKEYGKAWDDVHKAQSLGYAVLPGFIQDLQQAPGRDK